MEVTYITVSSTVTFTGVMVRVFVPNCSAQDVRFGIQLPWFCTLCDPNDSCQNSLFMSNGTTRAHFTRNVLAVHQLSISCNMLVGLAGWTGLVKLKVQRFVSNCMPTLFNWSRICLWIHFKHLIYESVSRICRLAEVKNRLEGKSFSPQCAGSLSL